MTSDQSRRTRPPNPWWNHLVPTGPANDARLRLDVTVQCLKGPDGNAVLLGGSPLRLLRLRPPADQLIDALRAGQPVPAALASLPEERQPAGAKLVATLVSRGLAHPVPRPNPSRPLHDVTIVIPVRNRPASLRRLLTTLRPLATRHAQTVVVDDGSTDSTPDVASEFNVQVVRRRVSGGPAAARNAGLAEVETTYVAFLDSDTVPIDGWLDVCLSHLDATTGISGIASVDLVAPRIASEPRATMAARGLHRTIEQYEHVRSPLDLGGAPAIVAPKTRVAYVPGAALVCRTDAVLDARGFDESLLVGEDVDLVWRLHAANKVLRYEPLAQVGHEHRTDAVDFVRRRFQYGTSAALLDRRHPGLVPPVVLSPWSAGAVALAAVGPFGPLGVLGVVAGITMAGLSATALPAKLPQLAASDARALALRGHIGAVEQLAESTARTWFPLAAILALFGRRARWLLLASIVVPGACEARRRRPSLRSVTFIGLRTVDNAAYGFGVWVGSLRARSFGALIPKIQDWPGRSSLGEDTKS